MLHHSWGHQPSRLGLEDIIIKNKYPACQHIQRPVTSHGQALSHTVVSSTPRHEWGSNSQLKW
jgi:hypothetical protein